jgi:hypothetical protein
LTRYKVDPSVTFKSPGNEKKKGCSEEEREREREREREAVLVLTQTITIWQAFGVEEQMERFSRTMTKRFEEFLDIVNVIVFSSVIRSRLT